MWKAVKQWFFLTSSPGWSLRGDPKRPPASVAKPQTPDVAWRHVTSMVVTSGGRWRVWGAWISKPMAHRRQKMAINDALWCNYDGNSSITCSNLFQLRPLRFLWANAARLRLVNWDDSSYSTQHPADAGERNAKNNGKRRVGIDMNMIWNDMK